ncbi:MAG: hypothetical protein ACK2UX_06850, partial [Anaerolineae bacterium]
IGSDAEIRINCWEDDHQDPVLPTIYSPDLPDPLDNAWGEFQWDQRDYPGVFAGRDEEPGTITFYDNVPNGTYHIIANLYHGLDSFRYYYGFDAGDPRAHSVDVTYGGEDGFAEFYLGSTTVTDGVFSLYTDDADLIEDGGGVSYGWAWLRLIPDAYYPLEMHYITERHEDGETISTGDMTLAGITLPPEADSLAATGTQPFLAVTTSGLGRAVQWGSYDWIRVAVKGRLEGFDDLVWRSIVWAARKPFVMQGIPPFVTMRIDDQEGDLWAMDMAISYGWKPWMGVFSREFTEAQANHLSDIVDAGNATASIHAFTWNDFFYWDHWNQTNFPDNVIADHYAEGTLWHDTYDIPISKFVIAHFAEIGENALPGLHDWGVEFIGTFILPGEPWGVDWWEGGPYHLYEAKGVSADNNPFYYADTYPVPQQPDLPNQFFNCMSNIRDEGGREWYPSNDVDATIDRGTRHLKRQLDSMVLAVLFTHDVHIQAIDPANMDLILAGITSNLTPYDPQFVTMDHACQYVRATYMSDIVATAYDPGTGELTVSLDGETDMPTQFYLFTEVGGEIVQELIDVPELSGPTDVVHPLAGPLDHIVVSPDPATVAMGATQQFTAQAYDADDNPLSALPFGWAVVSGGGSINNSGLFTAGSSPGLFTGTIVASYDGVEGYASVEVVEPTPDHFTFELIYSPQYAGVPFEVTIAARDASGDLLTYYDGPADLSDTTGTIAPSVTGVFAGGLWTGEVTIDQVALDVGIAVQDGTASGSSVLFDVEKVPQVYEVTSDSHDQTAGVPFLVTVSGAAEARINCWEDAHQDPVLETVYEVPLDIDNQWGEFKWEQRDYPVVIALKTETPGMIKFYGVVANGTYQVYANLFWKDDFRYYYGYDPASPRAHSIEVRDGVEGDFSEYELGTVTITDNRFALYTDHADVLIDRDARSYGWGWIRLVPVSNEVQINCWEDDHQLPVLPTLYAGPGVVGVGGGEGV